LITLADDGGHAKDVGHMLGGGGKKISWALIYLFTKQKCGYARTVLRAIACQPYANTDLGSAQRP